MVAKCKTIQKCLSQIWINKIMMNENMFTKVKCYWSVDQSLIWCCNDIIIQWPIITMCYNVVTTSYQWLYQHLTLKVKML